MTGLLSGKTAVITGAGSPGGIGRATARLFAAEGAVCALTDIDAAGLEEAVAEMGPPHRSYVCDVASAPAVRDTIAAVIADLGRIDVLINNAGIVMGTPFADITEDEFDSVLGVNLKGNFLMSQACLPAMRANGGAIVCIASIAGQNGGGVFGRSHYAAAKAGIMGLAKALGRELAPLGIRANAIAAGPVDNNFTGGRMTPEIKADLATKVPLGRLGTSDDIANACLFLASDMSSFVTGAVLDVNGGLHIH
ncbi:MAG: SDR family oxidoreductase [Rhodospirillales bacterium]|nr:SDR family oxidoreductase [Rhodospirillales bacterium]MBO6785841.1 SDR family oxidoreductase [Rhodospirillales bacterium]